VAKEKKVPQKRKKNSKKKRRSLIFIAVMAGAVFLAGLLLSPYLWRKGQELKEWLVKPPLLEETRVVKLYFSVPKEDYLFPQERKITSSPEISSQAKAILGELINGPTTSSLVPTIPPKTQVRAVYVNDKCIYADFSSSLLEEHPGGSSGELLTIYSIVNSLLDNLPSQSEVQILIQGKPANTLAGHIDIREPLSMNLDLVKVSPAG
jgi:germination protein M